jgi:hypothetical protein
LDNAKTVLHLLRKNQNGIVKICELLQISSKFFSQKNGPKTSSPPDVLENDEEGGCEKFVSQLIGKVSSSIYREYL